MANASILEINNLTIAFKSLNNYRIAVKGVSFHINKAETFALLGESGCGKSITSLAIMQLLPHNAALAEPSEIKLHGIPLTHLSEIEMRKIRGSKIAMVFQEPMTSLNPVLTVGQQIREVLKLHTKIRKRNIKTRMLQLLEEVQLPKSTEILAQYPHQLSGGMKQRVMLAIALAGEPELLIADEATSALDVTIQMEILKLLKSIQKKRQMSILFITHDLNVVKKIADRVGVMYAGHMIEEAPCVDFFREPLHPYSQKLFASLPSFTKRHEWLEIIPGIVPPLTSEFHGCRFASRCQYVESVCKSKKPDYTALRKQRYVRCFKYTNPELFTDEKIESKPQALTALAQTKKENVLEIRALKSYYPIQKGLFKRTVGYNKAVDNIDLDLPAGQTLALVGESGCGKTTLAKTILNLLVPTAGHIEVNVDGKLLRPMQNKLFHQSVQIIFQDPYTSMNPRMLVADIIAEGMRALKLIDEKQLPKKLSQLIEQVGLPEDSLKRYPHEFSGGQRQRICIARALAVEPKIIICDEPTSALDVSIQGQILNLLKQLQLEQQLSFLFITHNMAVVAYMADSIAVMKQGKIVEYASAKKILQQPEHDYTKQLMQAAM